MTRRTLIQIASICGCLALNMVWTSAVVPADMGAELFRFTATDGIPEDWLGWSVAMNGNLGVAGAPGSPGSVYTNFGGAYVFDISNGNERLKLSPLDAAPQHAFGSSVAINDEFIVVGSRLDDQHGYGTGSAYIFDTVTGKQLFKISASDGETTEFFGSSVAISDQVVLVGAPLSHSVGPDAGAAYLFDAVTGVQAAKFTAAQPQGSDRFGMSVATNGKVALIGAPSDFSRTPGSAYLFDLVTNQQLAQLAPSDLTNGDQFGYAVALQDHYAIVGANFAGAGSVYVFDIADPLHPHQISKLTAADGSVGDGFGASIAANGRLAIIGAPGDDEYGFNNGAAYLFDLVSGQQLAKFSGSKKSDVLFGTSVAMGENVVLVGSPFDQPLINTGSAYVFSVVPESGGAAMIMTAVPAALIIRRRSALASESLPKKRSSYQGQLLMDAKGPNRRPYQQSLIAKHTAD